MPRIDPETRPRQSWCAPIQRKCQGPGRRIVEAAFDAGKVTSESGTLLFQEPDFSTRMTERPVSASSPYSRPCSRMGSQDVYPIGGHPCPLIGSH